MFEFVVSVMYGMGSAQTDSYVEKARAVLREERQMTEAEERAFTAFRDSVADVDVDVDVSSAGATGTTGAAALTPVGAEAAQATAPRAIEQIRTAYRRTVMATDHYAEEYGDSLAESLASEFGRDIALALTTDAVFSPQLRESLVRSARESREKRTQFREVLKAERESIERAADRLSDVESAESERFETDVSEWDTDALFDGRDEVLDLLGRCESIATARQEEIHDHRATRARRCTGTEFMPYLYRSLSVTYPVLADVAAVVERLRSRRDDLDAEIVRR